MDNDGYLGPGTIQALSGNLGVADDRSASVADTAVAWQRALNAGRIF